MKIKVRYKQGIQWYQDIDFFFFGGGVVQVRHKSTTVGADL